MTLRQPAEELFKIALTRSEQYELNIVRRKQLVDYSAYKVKSLVRNKARDHRDYRNILIRLEAAFLLQLELVFSLARKAFCRKMILYIGVGLGIIVIGIYTVNYAAELIAAGLENVR